MKFSQSKYVEWLQHMVKKEAGNEYNFITKIKDMLQGNYHKGRKEGFDEAQKMFLGEGPIYVCKHPKQPWPELAQCFFATMIKEKFEEHLKEKHEIVYNDPENVDNFHKVEKMKDA